MVCSVNIYEQLVDLLPLVLQPIQTQGTLQMLTASCACQAGPPLVQILPSPIHGVKDEL